MTDTVVLEDSAPVIIIDREFGGVLTDDERYRQPSIPRIFGEIEDYLRTQSVLLQLAPENSLQGEIFEAYESDLDLLKSTLEEFVGFGKAAVRYSIKKETDSSEITEKVQKIWDKLEGRIPEVGRVPLLQLPAEQAGKSKPEMLRYLQNDFERGTDRLAKRMSYWLQLLVEEDLIGIVEWYDADVCRYHYFRQDLQERVVETQERRKHNRGLGGDIMRDELRKQEFEQERHTHHVVNAAPHKLDEYTKRVPERVADFISAVPDWLTPHLRLVDGTITQEEIVHEKAGKGVVTESEKIGEWKYSPTVALGPFSMVGWSGTDLKREPTTFYDDQQDNSDVQEKVEAEKRQKEKEKREERKRFWSKVRWRVIPVLAVLALAVFGIYSCEQSQNTEARAQYASFVGKWGEKGERMTLHSGDKFADLGSNKSVYVSHLDADRSTQDTEIGFVVLSDSISLAEYQGAPFGSSLAQAGQHYEFWVEKGSEIGITRYGSVDIQPMMKRPLEVHVLRGQVGRDAEEKFLDVSITPK